MEIGVSKADCYLIGQRREIQVALFVQGHADLKSQISEMIQLRRRS